MCHHDCRQGVHCEFEFADPVAGERGVQLCAAVHPRPVHRQRGLPHPQRQGVCHDYGQEQSFRGESFSFVNTLVAKIWQ